MYACRRYLIEGYLEYRRISCMYIIISRKIVTHWVVHFTIIVTHLSGSLHYICRSINTLNIIWSNNNPNKSWNNKRIRYHTASEIEWTIITRYQDIKLLQINPSIYKGKRLIEHELIYKSEQNICTHALIKQGLYCSLGGKSHNFQVFVFHLSAWEDSTN